MLVFITRWNIISDVCLGYLLKIPYGETITYGEIGKEIAKKNNLISIILPCHRVAGSKVNLTGYARGIDKKQSY